MFGEFGFNSTPLAPPGTKVLIYIKPSNRRIFGTHAIDGWYIGTSLSHYICYFCYVPETGVVRHADTVEFFPQKNPFLIVNTNNHLQQAASDILNLLKEPQTL